MILNLYSMILFKQNIKILLLKPEKKWHLADGNIHLCSGRFEAEIMLKSLHFTENALTFMSKSYIN